MNDCQIFSDASTYLANWQAKQPSVKEESLTDWLLFEISSKTPRVRYASFSRHDEARKTGADWEWWFLYPHGSYRYRIQAKKASPNGDNYASIAYTNRYGLQIDKLISDSKSANAIPAYVFYTASPFPQNSKCAGGFSARGAFSVGAQSVYSHFIARGKAAVSEADILKISIPLQCFTCCRLGSSLREPMDTFIEHYFSEERAILSGENIREGRSGFHSQLPSYVSELLDSTEEIPAWWHREYQSQLAEFNAVVIYDHRRRT